MPLHQFLWFFIFLLFRLGLQEERATSDSDVQDGICRSCAKGGRSVSCYCDNMCSFYKDCCFDAPIETNKSADKQDVRFSCKMLHEGKYIYAVSECSSSWNGKTDVQNKCEGTNDFQDGSNDLFTSIPVTDTKTNIIYLNQYCAECNNADQSNLSLFSLKLTCDALFSEVNKTYGNITEDFMSQNIIFHDYSWGVYHWDYRRNDVSFIPCWFDYKIPERFSFLVRQCQPFMISTCVPDWNDDYTQQLCNSSDMNIVYDNFGSPYRNAYCAACNNISANNTKCEPPITFTINGVTPPRPSFVILLDINSNNNETPCLPSQIYDSRSKKCRRLICTNPNEVPRYGKCIKNQT